MSKGRSFVLLLIALLAFITFEIALVPRQSNAVDEVINQKVEQHEIMLGAMNGYFEKLQNAGVLPRPDEIDKFKGTK